MPRKPRPPLSLVEKMQRIASCGIADHSLAAYNTSGIVVPNSNELEDLSQRIRRILGLAEQNKHTSGHMLFFVMYDIESDKVRRLVSHYLKEKGCSRIQRSIFLADTTTKIYNQIRKDLAEVQAAYDNQDSIIVLPVSADYLHMMKVIGKTVDLDIITHSRNTLFF